MAKKGDLCIMVVRNVFYNQETNSFAGEILMLASKSKKLLSPIYWKCWVIMKIFTSSKAAETGGINVAIKISILLKDNVKLRVFTDSRPLLDLLGVPTR